MSQCAHTILQQVSGGACSLTLYREAAPGCVEPGETGVRLSFMNESFAPGTNKQQRSVITGKRGAGKPYAGQPQYSGQVASASYSPQLGYMFGVLCGDPVTEIDPVRAIDAAAVTQIEMGVVGIPCAGHGFVQDAAITIHGTANYDGYYRVARGVTDDVIAIRAPYVAETIASGATVCRGNAAVLSGPAEDLGSGLVSLPTEGGIHILNAGETVTISGTTNYDGTYILQEGSEEGVLVIRATYADETFDGSVIAVPQFFRHVFTLPRRQPTACMEKYFDFEDEATLMKYRRFGFCKVNGMSYSLGGNEELVFSFDFAVGRMEESDAPLDADPVNPPAVPLDNIESAIWLAGKRRGDVETASFSYTMGIEPHAAIGDMGESSRMPEGDPTCQHTLQVFLEDDEYEEIANSRATIPFAMSVSSAAGDELWIKHPETELDAPTPAITGKEGLMQSVTVIAFVDKAESVMTIELFNRVQSYAV